MLFVTGILGGAVTRHTEKIRPKRDNRSPLPALGRAAIPWEMASMKQSAYGFAVVASLALGAPMLAGHAWGGERIDPIRLDDQSGAPADIAPSESRTLITFYRGDW